MQNLAADKDVQDEKKRKKEEKMRLKNKKMLAKKAKQNQAEQVMQKAGNSSLQDNSLMGMVSIDKHDRWVQNHVQNYTSQQSRRALKSPMQFQFGDGEEQKEAASQRRDPQDYNQQ